MALSRQQIRERKRHLQKQDQVAQTRQQSLSELNEAERLLEQKRSTRDQLSLQTASLCTAILSQIPEHRDGVTPIAKKATIFIERLLDIRFLEMTVPLDPDTDDEEDDEDEDEPALLSGNGSGAV